VRISFILEGNKNNLDLDLHYSTSENEDKKTKSIKIGIYSRNLDGKLSKQKNIYSTPSF